MREAARSHAEESGMDVDDEESGASVCVYKPTLRCSKEATFRCQAVGCRSFLHAKRGETAD